MSKRGGGGGRGRGGKRNMKGRNRQFNNPEEMERQLKEERENWREPKEGEGSGDEQQPVAQRGAPGELPPSDSDSEESSSDEEPGKAKGVEGIIEISNPNRAVKKTTKAVNVDVNKSGTSALTRREREQIEKEQARQRYNKLHAEGKTTEAQGDLARLAIIRKQREEAAKKKEQEKIAADAKAKARKK